MTCAASSIGPVGNSIAVLARVVGVNQILITQSSVASISRTIYQVGTGDIVTGPTTLLDTTVVFDVLQTDYEWDIDATGYNWRDIISGTLLTQSGALKIVYTIVDSGGLQTVMPFDYVAEAVT